MESNRLWELIAKRTAGEADPDELAELDELIRNHPEALYSMEIMEKYWTTAGRTPEETGREQSLTNLLNRIGNHDQMQAEPTVLHAKPASRGKLRAIVIGASIAASVLLLVAIWLQYDNTEKKPLVVKKPALKTLVAVKGNKSQFVLPDGSKLWLNAGTTVSYTEGIDTSSVREVFLSGEAFFQVVHNEKRPFIIQTAHMEIRDIGTSFNVKAYPSDKTTEATLIEGSIEVRMKTNRQSAVLARPNEKITVFNRSGQTADTATDLKAVKAAGDSKPAYVLTKVSPQQNHHLLETAWMDNMLVFENESFEELAVRMERWFDVQIRFQSEDLKKIRFTGAFADETVKQALVELQLMRAFHFSIEQNKIRISR
jgi:transmembrane sensor